MALQQAPLALLSCTFNLESTIGTQLLVQSCLQSGRLRSAPLAQDVAVGHTVARPGPCLHLTLFICCRYILPSLSLVPNDPEESVRVEYSSIIVPLAVTAHSFLMRLQFAAAAAAANPPAV